MSSYVHGMSGSRTHKAFKSMHARCRGYNEYDAKQYQGRGIRVCEEWCGRGWGFVAFLAHMGECPPGMTLDRIDGNRGYEPGNCRWATPKTQSRNRMTNAYVVYRDQRMVLQDACDEAGILAPNLYPLMGKGLSLQEAFDYLLNPTAQDLLTRWIVFEGQRMSLSAACRAAGIDPRGITNWVRRHPDCTHQEAFNRRVGSAA